MLCYNIHHAAITQFINDGYRHRTRHEACEPAFCLQPLEPGLAPDICGCLLRCRMDRCSGRDRIKRLPTIRLHDVTLGYDGHPAVHHLDGTFSSGSLTAVVGPNGSGKSTLLKGLSGALKPMGGHVDLNDGSLRDMAYLPQANDIDRTFPATVQDLVTLGLWRKRGLFARIEQPDVRLADKALAAVGLDGFQSRTLDTLSGGQFQRALFARVLLQDAQVILLDEPFAAIDGKTVTDLMHIVGRWHDEGRTVIAVLHDMTLVKDVFPDAVLLAREPVAWGSTDSVLSDENLMRARRMHEAWDEHASHCARDAA